MNEPIPSRLSSKIAAFAVLYGIFLSFGELGPGNCLGLLASKLGPTAVRGQFYGTAAAIGKIGAFVGTWAFPPMIDAFGGSGSLKGNTGPFWIGSGLAVFSALVTFFMIRPLEADGMKLEEEKVGRSLPFHLLPFKLTPPPFEPSSAPILLNTGGMYHKWDSRMSMSGRAHLHLMNSTRRRLLKRKR
jgi:hypothetical protein